MPRERCRPHQSARDGWFDWRRRSI